jgi:hypothetical protein
MSLTWIAISATVPLLAGLAVSSLIWRISRDHGVGNALGAAVIFLGAIVFLARERTVVAAIMQACVDRGTVCFAHPDDFTRYGVYIGISFAQVMVLYLWSLRVEERKRRKGVDRKWW